FIEPKGYVFMGRSRQRLGRDHAPEHAEIAEFARRLARGTGYELLDESPESKVVLLGQNSVERYLPGLAPATARAA
ncbi:MAG TPA: hypothetical protein VEE86_01170, partial [Thermoplasmata archaeon]|nr:hypothetical protein [Thermoplasmata archaeon]